MHCQLPPAMLARPLPWPGFRPGCLLPPPLPPSLSPGPAPRACRTVDQFMNVFNPPNAEPIVMERITSDLESRPGGPTCWIHTKARGGVGG